MSNHKTLAQASIHETKAGTGSINGVSVFSNYFARQTASPVFSLASGNNTLFTCPAGKKAIRLGRTIYNPTVGSVNVKPMNTYSSVDYTGSAINIGTGASNTSISGGNAGFNRLFVAGEVLKMNSDTSGVLVTQNFLVFDSSAPLVQAVLDTLIIGDNTLYTCPAGKTAMVLSCGSIGALAELSITNNSGGAVSYYANVVQSGGSVSASNQIIPAASVSNNASATRNLPGISLSAGDYISINSTAATTQTALVLAIIAEMDA